MPVADSIAVIVARNGADPRRLLQILREAQAELGWISLETIEALAAQLGIARTRIESVVQFYAFLYDRPRGAYRLLVSDNVTDRMAGNLALFERGGMLLDQVI